MEYAVPIYNRDNIEDIDEMQLQFTINDQTFLDTLLMKIRSITIPYASHKKKSKNEKRENIEKELIALQLLHQNDTGDITLENKIQELNIELENIRKEELKGIIIRARTRWIENGEKPTKYFCALEKRNYTNKNIYKLTDSNGEDIVNQEYILESVKQFYKNLYTSKDADLVNSDLHNMLKDFDIPKLKETDKKILDSEIDIQELGIAVRNLKNDKSPGPDGYTAEFFKFFWPDLKYFIFRSIQNGIAKGELSTTQKMGIISLLPKGNKPREYIKNWRPISLLNLSYKILSNCLANRLKKVLYYLIHENQKGFLKDRYIGENTRQLYDIMQYLSDTHSKGLLLLIDFEKAFDSISWKFIDDVLEFFNFGDNFKHYIKCLNKDFKLCVIQHGIFSSFFNVGRGCRQGDPISPYIFILCVEILGIMIRNNKNIKGINIGDIELKIIQYADDTALTLDGSDNSLRIALSLLDQFSKFSGLKPNIDKTRCIWLGSKIHSSDTLCDEYPLVWSDESFTFLGIIFSVDTNNMVNLNYSKKLEEIQKLIGHWSRRLLSPLGKITVIKSILLPKLTHLFISLPNPTDNMINNLESEFFQFLWSKKPDKISRKLAIQDYSNGGLNMIHVKSFIKSMKITWMKRLLMGNSKWIEVFEKCLNVERELLFTLGPEFSKHIANRTKNQFWKDTLYCYNEFRMLNKKLENSRSCLYNEIWYNNDVKINNRHIFYRLWYDKGIRYIIDLFDENGIFLTYNSFCEKFMFNPPILSFYGLRESLYNAWPELRQQQQLACLPIFPYFIRTILFNKANKVSVYSTFVSFFKYKCAYKEKWIGNLHVNIDEKDWKCINSLMFKITQDTYIRWFQYRIIHRTIATNVMLYRYNIVNSELCTFCGQSAETIFHLFIECMHVDSFWKELRLWFLQVAYIDITLDPFDICLIKKVPKNQAVLNLIITLAKRHIYNQRLSKKIPRVDVFLLELKKYYFIEKYIYAAKQRHQVFNSRWSLFHTVLQ